MRRRATGTSKLKMSRLTIKPIEIPANINYQVMSHGDYFII
jgi:hypothetical protein